MTYTKDELKKAISEKESQIRNLKLESEGRGTQSQKYAEIPGFPDRKSDDQRCGKEGWKCENPSNDGSAFIQVSGNEGLYVRGYLSETYLDQVKSRR